jgi:aconitate hydratase
MLPFTMKDKPTFKVNDYIFIPNVREVLSKKLLEVDAYVISGNNVEKIVLNLHEMTEDEIQVLLSGCLINYNKKGIQE